MARGAGKVRAARLTDLAALGELSRLAQNDGESHALPGAARVGAPDRRCSACSACRWARSGRTTCCTCSSATATSRACCASSARRPRDEWTMVELDAVGEARRRRHPLPPRPAPVARRFEARGGSLSRRVRRRRRQHRAVHAGRLHALRGGADAVPRRSAVRLPRPWTDEAAAECGIRPTAAQDAVALSRLYARVTPAPVQRLEGIRHAGLGAPGHAVARPAHSARARSSGSRTSRRSSRPRPTAARTAPSSRRSSRSASPRRTSRTTCGRWPCPGVDLAPLVAFGLGVIAAPRRGA